MAQVDTNDTKGSGNTSTSPPTSKANPRGRSWCFTLNNYTQEEYDTVTHEFLGAKYWIIGKELGDKKQTPHLQCYVQWKNAISFNSMKKKFPRASLRKAKGTPKQNLIYCSKDNNYETNMDFRTPQKIEIEEVLKEYKETKWHEWQQNILNLLKTKPNNRTINWYVDKKGNSGKSYLCKYIDIKYDVILCEGKQNDIFNQLKTYVDEKKKFPTIIICDVPRSSVNYINYGALEKLKNGHVYSGKYEGGKMIFRSPHVIVFANEFPDYSKMSEDRWNVVVL